MQNFKTIIVLIILTLLVSGCSIKEEKNQDIQNKETNNKGKIDMSINANTEDKNIENLDENKSDNEVYNQIVDKKTGLQNATSEDLDKILQEELRMLNTPTSDYLFFEQSSTKVVNIEEVQKSGGMEITRGNIYLHGINTEYNFISEFLSENEKLYSFYQENNENTFFYLDNNEKEFLEKIKNKFTEYKVNIDEKEFKEISFRSGGKEYSLQVSLPTLIGRDDIDNILQTTNKTKITIILLK